MKAPTWSWQMIALFAVIAAAGIAAMKMGHDEVGGALLLGLIALAGVTQSKKDAP